MTTAQEQDKATDDLRAGLHAMWSSVAPGWAANAGFVDRRAQPLTEAMLERSAVKAGDRVLELACGAGGTGLAAAELVGDGGEVVISDVAPEMVETGKARAAERGLGNVAGRVLDLEQIDAPDASYDVVLCREGLMLVPDPIRAAGQIARVLRPGGRFAIAVWGPREQNPALRALFDSVGAQLGHEVPPPGVPGPFSLDDEDRFAEVLSEGGLSNVAVAGHEVPFEVDSVEHWFSIVSALAGPLANVLANLPEEARNQIRDRAGEQLAQYRTKDGLEIPGLALLGSGTKAR